MSTYLKPAGYFRLNDSDNCYGSFFNIQDTKDILHLSDDMIERDYPFVKHDDGEYWLDEETIQKIWYKTTTKERRNTRSFDEMVLRRLLGWYIPFGYTFEEQVRVGKYQMDFLITSLDDHKPKFFLEFDGVGHFICGRYGEPKNYNIKKNKVEEMTGIPVVNWAFWIQRCETNIKRLFDNSIVGKGRIWNSSKLFSDFYFKESADMIIHLNNIFGIKNCRDFYNGTPSHPVYEKYLKNPLYKTKFLPKGYQYIVKDYFI